jgi:LPPG:FO 2-phospho-L-lactate transferase
LSVENRAYVALAGGVGGAKLADGLSRLLGERLTVVVNTGDDFEHLGLHISPDLDTVVYTLAGVADAERGWGLAGETWAFMDQVARLGGPDWFRLGDRDLATHAIRTSRLAAGASLTEITAELCRALGVKSRVVPMSDQPVRTIIHTPDGSLPFQDYFVRLRCAVPVTRVWYEGAGDARINPLIDAMRGSDAPSAIFICPSNPYLSIDPILSVPGLRDWVRAVSVPVIAISPIVGGAAIKGPAAKMMQELGTAASATSVARHYRGLVSSFVIDHADRQLSDEIEAIGMNVRVASTIMRSNADRVALAQDCLLFADALSHDPRGSHDRASR